MSSDVVAHSSTEDRHTVDDEAYEPSYAEAFPPLPVASTCSTVEEIIPKDLYSNTGTLG